LRSKKRLDELLAEVDKWKMRCGQADIERSKIAADLEECRAHVLDWQDKYIKTEASLQRTKSSLTYLKRSADMKKRCSTTSGTSWKPTINRLRTLVEEKGS
jgi:chromosome segregation ATPase